MYVCVLGEEGWESLSQVGQEATKGRGGCVKSRGLGSGWQEGDLMAELSYTKSLVTCLHKHQQ